MGPEIRVGLDFEEALQLMKDENKAMARAGWNGAGLKVIVQSVGPESKMTRPYLVMCPSPVDFVPWLPSQTDLFASDWYVVE